MPKCEATMRIVIVLAGLLIFPGLALGQVEFYPTFTITSNDVAQSSIMVFRVGGTNQTRVSIKFAYTETGAKRVEQFYAAHPIGKEIRYQIGNFEHVARLDNRKHFSREGFWGLPEVDANALVAGLRGQK